MWTCVALTCCSSRLAKALREELSNLKEQKLIDPQLPCFVLEDPIGTIGSGGATLNALLVTVEKLCTIKGHSTITSDVLANANILIIHQGRNSCYWSNGKTFFPIEEMRSDGSGLKTYLEYLIDICSQLKENAPAGIWVASADMMLHGNLENTFNWNSSSPDALLITLSCRNRDADFCGVVHINTDGTVRAISYNFVDESDSAEEISIVGGIVYLTTEVAESVLSLSSMPELDSCTYIGSDNGSKDQQFSLYFDLLGPMCSNVDMAEYLSGDYGSSYDRIFGIHMDELNRERLNSKLLIWNHLHTFKLNSFLAQGLHHSYMTDRLPMERFLGNAHVASTLGKVIHSFAKYPKNSLICANSTIEAHLDFENKKDLIVISSSIKATENQTLNVRGKAFIISAQLNIDEIPEFYLGDNHCLVGYCIRTQENELKEGRAIFSASDIPILDRNHPLATVFAMKWDRYLELKGFLPEDLWDCECQSLLTAKLFPLTEDITSWRNFLWLQDFSGTPGSLHRLKSWRISKRYSMIDFIQLCDPFAAFHQRRQTTSLAVCQSISEWERSLIPYLHRARTENWSEILFEVLDRIAAKENRAKASRALATIADLLGLLAGPEGGLRSGPASNKDWLHAFYLLENVSVEEGVYALASQRSKWMDTPEHLIRAARHYERAIHIMIRQVVQSVQAQMVDLNETRDSFRPSIGHWIEVECPARIDLSGGWSDTPPICYEMGGLVVNMAILVNGKKPIGARGRRLEGLQLVLSSEGQSEPLVITSLDDVMTYTNPTAPGALLKAALVCAGVVRKDSSQNFSQQLLETLGGGLELHGWSLLPQGSGLGTSSILASALLAVIYTCMGVPFNRSQLIHAVLYIEQLLTTGGGWQDQVGGIMGGVNRGNSPADANVHVHVESLPVTDSTAKNLNLLLVHTGKVRLARNLLQNVIRQWYARDETIVACFRSLIENAVECRQALVLGDIPALGRTIDTYWAQKKAIAPGSEPQFVRELMDRMSPHVYGQSLAGAGGGGFYFALLKENSDRGLIENVISSVKGADKMVIYSADLDRTGISRRINNHLAHIPS